jgi:hypothetical protein
MVNASHALWHLIHQAMSAGCINLSFTAIGFYNPASLKRFIRIALDDVDRLPASHPLELALARDPRLHSHDLSQER